MHPRPTFTSAFCLLAAALLLALLALASPCRAQFGDYGGYGGFGQRRSRHFGMPNAGAHSNDNFDLEKTRDEAISARMNPLPFVFNPGMRVMIGGLQNMEARSLQSPVARVAYSPVLALMTNQVSG